MLASCTAVGCHILCKTNLREGADGDLTPAAEAVEKGAFAGCGGTGVWIVQESEEVARLGVAFADFDAEGSLSCSGTHDFSGDDLLDQLRFTEALQACQGEDDGVVFALLKFSQTSVNVATQRINVEIGTDGFELRLATKARGPDAGALRKFLKTGVVARAEGVARVLPLGDGRDFKSLGKFGGQIFERVHG